MAVFGRVVLLIFFIGNIYAAELDMYLTEGDFFYRKFDNLAALKKYEAAYKLNPGNYEVLLRLARTYNDAGEEFYELREMDGAETYINKAVKFSEIFKNKFPDSAASYTYMAMSLGNLALFKGGKEKVKLATKIRDNALQAVKMDPDNYVNYIILGIYNRELSRLSWLERAFANTFFGSVPEGSLWESEKYFKKALELDSDMIIATFQLSKTYREMDETKKEIELLRKIQNMKMRDFRDKFAKKKSQRRLEELTN